MTTAAKPDDGPLLQGRWRLGRALGRGAQGQTFLATEVARREEVVIKRVKLGAGWKSFELHERETKVLGQLRHPGVPRLLGALFPSAYYQSIALGTFAKGLGLADLAVNCGVLAAFGLGFVAVAAALLDKQEA